MQDQKIRLQKMLADCGVASRRKAEELIQQGKVKVNGHVAQIGDKVNPKTDHVTVAGRGQAGPGFGGPAADDQRRGVRQPDHASQQART